MKIITNRGKRKMFLRSSELPSLATSHSDLGKGRGGWGGQQVASCPPAPSVQLPRRQIPPSCGEVVAPREGQAPGNGLRQELVKSE